VREIISIRVACAGAQETKGSRQEGRKKSHKKCILFSRMRGAAPSGWISTKLGKCAHLTDVIKLAKFHR